MWISISTNSKASNDTMSVNPNPNRNPNKSFRILIENQTIDTMLARSRHGLYMEFLIFFILYEKIDKDRIDRSPLICPTSPSAPNQA